MSVEPGDYVEVFASGESVSGVLLESPLGSEDLVVVKLDSGYNLGVCKDRVERVLLKRKKVVANKIVAEVKKRRVGGGLPKISILHTGGTIASKVDYKTGGVTAKISAGEFLEMFPELSEIADVSSSQIGQMQSEMMRLPHYNVMARAVEREVKGGADGVIIAHGTDTLHYSSAALAFALEGLPVPVVLVGAQRSSDRGSTDAALNLISAAYFIANSDFSGVGVCMHESISDGSCLILPALKTRKMHTSRRDAFRPVNAGPVARVDYGRSDVSFIAEGYDRVDKGRKLSLRLFDESLKVGIVKTHVNMFASQFLAYEGFDGLVVEGTGIGHVPNEEIDEHTAENGRIHEAVKRLVDSGTVVVMSSQTVYGRINMNVYAPQRKLQEAGVLGHLSDMTSETAYVKLVWLLSNYGKDDVRKLMGRNLRGEISARTEERHFLV